MNSYYRGLFAFICIIFTVIRPSSSNGDEESFYDLLNVKKDANLVEIRRQFKALAIKYHPDKNKDDPKAHEKFVRINRAYEVLKDDELRKTYDTYGEEGLKEGAPRGQHYESWHFYNDQFGIYDNDPEIVTLSSSDFEQQVLSGHGQRWFVNFYSAHCSHCHHLAPEWRKLANDVGGAFRIGAVNCLDDSTICDREGIRSFPSLIIYPEKIRYNGRRDAESLMEFILNQINAPDYHLDYESYIQIVEENEKKLKNDGEKPILLDFYDSTKFEDDGDTLPTKNRHLLWSCLENLVDFMRIDCSAEKKLCEKLGPDYKGLVFFKNGDLTGKGHIINSLDVKEIVNLILELLPDYQELSKSEFTKVTKQIEDNLSRPWLVEFVDEKYANDASNFELRKLPALLKDIKVGRVNCSKFRQFCLENVRIHKFPTFALFKNTGGYEIFYGRQSAYDLASFAHEAAAANLQSLGPDVFPSKVIVNDESWFVDFFAPWCPPCMKLLPEFRKASKLLNDKVKFGTIDCTVHQSLCTKFNVRSYPTTIFYNVSTPHPFVGRHYHKALIEFIEDVKNPSLISLDGENFDNLVRNRKSGSMWIVDFFNPHCFPCQQLAPEYRKLAKMMKKHESINFGQVDCLQEKELCRTQHVNGYPTIRLYPVDQEGYTDYNSWYRDAYSIRQWIFGWMPSSVTQISGWDFFDTVLHSDVPYLIDFYAPWCGHCHQFAPEYEKVAKALKDRVNVVKIDCDSNVDACTSAGIRGYPTLKFYAGVRSQESATSKQHPFGEEISSQNANFIVNFVEKKLRKTNPSRKDEL